MPLTSCPSNAELKRLFQSGLSPHEAVQLEEHVADCAACAANLKKLMPAHSTLADALQGSETLDDPPLVSQLIHKLQTKKPAKQGAAMVAFACSKCQKKLSTKSELAGRAVKCPGCGTVVRVPSDPATQALVTHSPPSGDGVTRSTTDALENTKAPERPANGGDDELTEFLSPPQAEGELGRLGKYRVLKILGHGGMGVVFRAEDPVLKRSVALKVMLPSMGASKSAGKRFIREAQAMASLDHDHIVRVFDAGEERGIPFLAMEFLKGEPLDKRLERDKTLPINDVVRIGREVAEGLAAAHETGMIHRDIKPGNLWIESTRNRVKILDFGLARAAAEDSHLTQTGAIMGTPAYMAPEQARGETVDGRCDLFSLGVVLYRLVTGQQPFRGKDAMSTLMALAMETPLAPHEFDANVPAELSDIIMKLMAKDRDERTASASEAAQLLRDLEHQLAPAPMATNRTVAASLAKSAKAPAPPVATKPAGPPPAKRRRWPLVVALGVMLVAALAAAAVVLTWETPTGIVRIEIDDPAITAAITDTAVTLKGAGERDFTIRPGNFGLRITDGKDLDFETDRFDLRKGEKIVLRVKIVDGKVQVARNDNLLAERPRFAEAKKTAPDPVNPKAAPTRTPPLADKEKPFVLIRNDKVVREFKTYYGLRQDLQNGDIIEMHGNGPFELPRIALSDMGLSIRAAKGYRPKFVPPADLEGREPWIKVGKDSLRLEGCDFNSEGRTRFLPLIHTEGACEIIGCRLVKAASGTDFFMALAGPKNRIANSLIICGHTYVGIFLDPEKELEFENNLVWSDTYQFFSFSPTGGQKLHLKNNTFFSGNIAVFDDRVKNRVHVTAEKNLFVSMQEGNLFRAAREHIKSVLELKAQDNVFVSHRKWARGYDGKEQTPADVWAKDFGDAERGSRDVTGYGLTFLAGYRGTCEEQLAPIRKWIEASRPKKSDAGPEDWDIIGAGDAYVKALEKRAGKPLSPDALRPEALAAGPVVLLRSNKVVAGFRDVFQASLAAQNDDVIELRTDRELPECNHSDQPGRTLTVRAAPGYRPIIHKLILGKDDVWSFEGIHFQTLVNGIGPVEWGEPRQLINCSFDFDPNQANYMKSAVITRRDTGRPEVINCRIPNATAYASRTNRPVLFRNSVIGGVWCFVDDSEYRVELDHCAVWRIGLGGGAVTADSAGMKTTFHATSCWFESGPFISANPTSSPKWTGDKNVFAPSIVAWSNLPLPDLAQNAINLNQWKTLWNSDAASVAVDSICYDPANWRLIPGEFNPPIGDVGANIDRVLKVAPK